MNILLSHVYSKHNNGDAAIVSAQIGELKRTFSEPQLHILTIESIRPGDNFDGVPMVNALMYSAVAPGRNRFKKLFMAIGMMGYTSLWAYTWRLTRLRLPLPTAWQKPMQLLVEADMQVCVGGGYLRAKADPTSTMLLLLLFHQIWLAKLLRKPVYLYAQSFGPYPTKLQRFIAKHGLRQADVILVREAKSKQLLDRLGFTGEQVIQVPDSAFMFDPPITPSLVEQMLGATKLRNGPIVGVTVRAWLNDSGQAVYERAMAEFIDHVQVQGFRVVVIPQVTSTEQNDDDRVVGQRIKQLLKHFENVAVVDKRFTHYEIKSVFAGLDYLVGTRFHSVIFALTARVPAIAVEYEHKTSGIMQDLGLEEWVIPIEAVTAAELVSRFDRLQHAHSSYVKRLNSVVPAYVAQAQETGKVIKLAYEQSHAAPGVPNQARRTL
jgi:colanic acid/amylovoran biosynthesis protein